MLRISRRRVRPLFRSKILVALRFDLKTPPPEKRFKALFDTNDLVGIMIGQPDAPGIIESNRVSTLIKGEHEPLIDARPLLLSEMLVESDNILEVFSYKRGN